MKIFITFVSLFLATIFVSNAQTTVRPVIVNGQQYSIQYTTDTFTNLAAGIESNGSEWWGSESLAKSFADATYAQDNNLTSLRFAYGSVAIGSGYAQFMTQDSAADQYELSSQSASYAISAVAVPAPLPILGILPVVGFLKRMRRRQRA